MHVNANVDVKNYNGDNLSILNVMNSARSIWSTVVVHAKSKIES